MNGVGSAMRQKMKQSLGRGTAIVALAFGVVAGVAAAEPMSMHHESGPAAPDGRSVAHFPPAFKAQELANMRSHLEALHTITLALAAGDFQTVARTASERLTRNGMSQHDRHQAASLMPERMMRMGAAMHKAAGHLAEVAQDAEVTGDTGAVLKALAEVEGRCVSCHRAWRME